MSRGIKSAERLQPQKTKWKKEHVFALIVACIPLIGFIVFNGFPLIISFIGMFCNVDLYDLGNIQWNNFEGFKSVFIPSYQGQLEEGQTVSDYNKNLFYRNDKKAACPDPFVLDNTAVDSWYYLYGTEGSVYCYRSKNLMDWERVGNALDNMSFDGPGKISEVRRTTWKDIWAPEVVYDAEEQLYYMFFSATPEEQNIQTGNGVQAGHGNYLMMVAVSKYPDRELKLVNFKDPSSCGEENMHTFNEVPGTKDAAGNVMAAYPHYYAKYLLFDPAEYNRFVDEGMGGNLSHTRGGYMRGIDPHPYVDADGTKYLFWVDSLSHNGIETSRSSNRICGVKMDNWLKPDWSTASVLMCHKYYTVEDWVAAQAGENVELVSYEPSNRINEGPFVIERNGKYYLTFSVGSYADSSYQTGQAVADNILGPYRKLTEAEGGVLISGNTSGSQEVSGTGHHSFITVDDSLYIIYHRHDSVVVALLGALAGCNTQNIVQEVPVTEEYSYINPDESKAETDSGIVIDGVLDEEAYAESKWLYLNNDDGGNNVNIAMTSYYGEKGIYFVYDVTESVPIYVNLDRESYMNSCIEMYLVAPYATSMQENDVFEIDLVPTGDMLFKRNNGKGGYTNVASMNDIMACLGTTTKGGEVNTRDCYGYCMELFIPWDYLQWLKLDVEAIKDSYVYVDGEEVCTYDISKVIASGKPSNIDKATAKVSFALDGNYGHTTELPFKISDKSNDVMIVVDSVMHGNVSVDKESCKMGDTIKLTLKGDPDHYYTNVAVNGLKIEPDWDGTYSFKATENIYIITAEFAPGWFLENAESSWNVLKQNQGILKLESHKTGDSGWLSAAVIGNDISATVQDAAATEKNFAMIYHFDFSNGETLRLRLHHTDAGGKYRIQVMDQSTVAEQWKDHYTLTAAEEKKIKDDGLKFRVLIEGTTVITTAHNNKETNRKNSDSRVSEHAAREIYLKAFEIIVKTADPWYIMS